MQLGNAIETNGLQVRKLHEKHVRKCGSKIRAIERTAFWLHREDVVAFAAVQLHAVLLRLVTLPYGQKSLTIALHPGARSKALLTEFFRHELETPVCDNETRMDETVQNLSSAFC
jgi:hypothetical protein